MTVVGGSTDHLIVDRAGNAQGNMVLEVQTLAGVPVTDVTAPSGWTGQAFPAGQARADANGYFTFIVPDGTGPVQVRTAARTVGSQTFEAGQWLTPSGQIVPDSGVEQALAEKLDTGVASATYARSRGLMAPVTRVLDFQAVTGATALVSSIGSDGLPYGAESPIANRIVRSTDGFATVQLGQKFADIGEARKLIWATRTAEGYVAIVCDSAANTAGIYFSTSFATGYTKVHECKATALIAIGRPTVIDGDTLLTVGEYGSGGEDRALFLTQNGGQTWTQIRNHVAVNPAVNNHCHGAAFDPVTGRLWASFGDQDNCLFSYSDDRGQTWVDVPANGAGPEDVNTIYNHPTAIVVTSDRVVTTPDGSPGKAGVWVVDKSTGYVTPTYAIPANVSGYRAWGNRPVAQDGDEVYLVFPPAAGYTAAPNNQLYVAGTADGGKSWYTLYQRVADDATNIWYSGIVGPDAADNLYMSGKVAGTSIVLRAPRMQWASRASIEGTQAVPLSKFGERNGVATLDNNGQLPVAQAPDVGTIYRTLSGDRLWLPASAFGPTQGTPTIASGGGFLSGYALDPATSEGLSAGVRVPAQWTAMDVVAHWTNNGAGAGSVVWRLALAQAASGENPTTAPPSFGDVTSVAGTANVICTATLASAIALAASKDLYLKVLRVATLAGDTLANDALLLGIELIRTA